MYGMCDASPNISIIIIYRCQSPLLSDSDFENRLCDGYFIGICLVKSVEWRCTIGVESLAEYKPFHAD